MHSCIYQIMRSKDENRIDESDFYEHLDDIPADYVRDLDEDDEDDYIKALPNFLPQSMFKCEGREITFLGGDKDFIEEWKAKVKAAVDGVIPGEWQPLYELKKVVNDMLGIACRFYSEEDGYVTESTEFILDCMKMKPGTKFYVGAVIDYHY